MDCLHQVYERQKRYVYLDLFKIFNLRNFFNYWKIQKKIRTLVTQIFTLTVSLETLINEERNMEKITILTRNLLLQSKLTR